MTDLRRRAFLSGLALLPLAGCATEPPPPSPPPSTTSSTPPPPKPDEQLLALEQKYDARLGIYATRGDAELAHRADERFAFCSTFKALATAAVLHANPMAHLDTVVTYTTSDLMKSSAITRDHVTTGMTLRALADAAVRYSDGTAGNLLLQDVGGPTALTEYLRGLGDEVTRMDRIEPDLTTAVPGDPRDTTTPRAIGTDYRQLILGDALPAEKRDFLRDLMERNVTGAKRIRAGLPAGWRIADKTGTGDYATANDIGVLWPPSGTPIAVAIMTSKTTQDADYDEALIAEAAAHVVATLT